MQSERKGKTLDEDVMVNEHEAVLIVGLSVSTLRNKRWACSGPPYYKIGSSVRYRLADLRQYREAHRIDPTRREG